MKQISCGYDTRSYRFILLVQIGTLADATQQEVTTESTLEYESKKLDEAKSLSARFGNMLRPLGPSEP